MTVSWCILTYNRGEIVKRSISHCLENAGAPVEEIVWCDNGSTDRSHFSYMHSIATTAVLNRENLGVAKGYNRAMGLATMDYIVITGSDMLLAPDWLATMLQYVEKIHNTACACIYSKPLEAVPERIKGPKTVINGLPIVPAMAIERRIFRRSLLREFGYFPETFGKYGYDDLAWAGTVERVSKRLGLINYVIPDMQAIHLGTEGIAPHDGKDAADYHAFKRAEVLDKTKITELMRRQALGWPKYDWPSYE